MNKLSVTYQTYDHPPSVIRSVNLAKSFMTEHLMEHVPLKKLARQVGTNEYTLKKGFKAVFKITVYQYLLKKRMELAFKLLAETNQKEVAIAMDCGFETLSGFVTAFYKHFNIRPKDVRKKTGYF